MRVAELYTAGPLPAIVHCGAQTTADTEALAAHAASVGAAGVAVIGPPYFVLDERAQLEHFRRAARACAPLPFYVYEFERASGYAVPLDASWRSSRSELPNLAGLKVSDSPFEPRPALPGRRARRLRRRRVARRPGDGGRRCRRGLGAGRRRSRSCSSPPCASRRPSGRPSSASCAPRSSASPGTPRSRPCSAGGDSASARTSERRCAHWSRRSERRCSSAVEPWLGSS